MESVQMAASSAPSTAKDKTSTLKKNTGRGPSKKNARKNAAASKRGGGRPKGRGRNKTYDDPRVQAAYDRQKTLRDMYTEVASVIKPVLENLADRNLKTLMENPTAHEEVPEYDILKRQLDQRLADRLRDINREFNTKSTITTRQYELNTAVTEKKFHDGYSHSVEEFLDASLARSKVLEKLQLDGLGIDHPDSNYTFVEKSNDVLKEQGQWVVFHDGIKIPEPHLLEKNKKAALAKALPNKTKPSTKRKAEDQADGQPDLKKSFIASLTSVKPDNGDESTTPLPRHIGGLLSAAKELDAEPESNAPSPSPDSDPKIEVFRGRKDLPDLPNGASEPDRWGVRTVNRRGPRANNRLILPVPFTFDDSEIGFRDSTNDSSKKATRGTRGSLLDTPNVKNLHIDRTIVTYDCLTYEDDALDPELVQKHNIHPKYGLFLPESRNESEPPKPLVSGLKPIVVITPNGATLQASRSVRGCKMDATLREDTGKSKLSMCMNRYCDEAGIDPEEITTEEMRQREQQRLASQQPSVTVEDPVEASAPHIRSSEVEEVIAKENLSQLLNAASHLEHDRPGHPTNPKSSRPPYDAVRDVFTKTEADAVPHTPPMEIDTAGLSLLADMAEQATQPREPRFDLETVRRMEPSAADHPPTPNHRLETQVEYHPAADQRAENQVGYHPTLERIEHQVGYRHALDQRVEHPVGYRPILDHRGDVQHDYRPDYQLEHHMTTQLDYRPEYHIDRRSAHHREHRLDQVEVPSMGDSMIDPRLLGPSILSQPTQNAFLKTALNPQPPLANIAPMPAMETYTHPPVGKIPFTNQGIAKGSPVLPPLRPSRREKSRDLAHASPPTLMQRSSDYGTSFMMQSNSGAFIPPGPRRAFHHAYSSYEPNPTMTMHHSQSLAMSSNMGQSQPTPFPATSYRPSYQPQSPTISSHPQLAAMPMHMPHGSPGSPPGSSMGLHSPTGPPGSRHRASISSGSNGSNNAKYRKIAAAPIPHNRPWQATTGQELRLAHYDHKEAIKDYRANEPPPRTGPTTIRGWNVNNVSKGRKGLRKEDSEEKDSPNITTFINKWNPSDKTIG